MAHARWDQHPPKIWEDAYVLLVLSGRGSGKTRMGSEWVHRLARTYPGCYIGMIAPTVDAARDVLIEGDAGSRLPTQRSGPHGSRPSANSPGPTARRHRRLVLTCPNDFVGLSITSCCWMRPKSLKNFEEAWSNALFGLRLGAAPKV